MPSTCLLTQEIDYNETQLRLLLPKDVDQSGRRQLDLCHRLLLDKEEEELALRPILPWNVPISGSCAQAHTASRVQAKPDAFTKRHFSTSFAKSWCPHSCRPLHSRDFPRETSCQRLSLIGILQALQRYVQGYDWVFEVRLSPVLACLHCPKGLLIFDSHMVFWLLLPYSFLCCDSTALPILHLQILCEFPGRKHASPQQPPSSMWSNVPTSSTLNFNSSAPFLMAASG